MRACNTRGAFHSHQSARERVNSSLFLYPCKERCSSINGNTFPGAKKQISFSRSIPKITPPSSSSILVTLCPKRGQWSKSSFHKRFFRARERKSEKESWNPPAFILLYGYQAQLSAVFVPPPFESSHHQKVLVSRQQTKKAPPHRRGAHNSNSATLFICPLRNGAPSNVTTNCGSPLCWVPAVRGPIDQNPDRSAVIRATQLERSRKKQLLMMMMMMTRKANKHMKIFSHPYLKTG